MKYLVTLRVHFSALLPTPLGDNCNQLHSNRAQNCLLVGPNLTFFFYLFNNSRRGCASAWTDNYIIN